MNLKPELLLISFSHILYRCVLSELGSLVVDQNGRWLDWRMASFEFLVVSFELFSSP